MDHHSEALAAFETRRDATTDINQHLQVLRLLGKTCGSTIELGVRGGESSHAFILGCMEHGKECYLLGRDLSCMPRIYSVWSTKTVPNVHISFEQGDDCILPPKPCDVLFIDTFHVYGQLKRELAHYADTTRHVIVMHDTEIDAVRGELLRVGWNADAMSEKTGIPKDELLVGLQPAIDEFLRAHPEWMLLRKYNNNNGLTILARTVSDKLAELDALLPQ